MLDKKTLPSTCVSKRAYATVIEAREAATEQDERQRRKERQQRSQGAIRKVPVKRMREYQCDVCGLHHLTTAIKIRA
jgi:hypothetical protein